MMMGLSLRLFSTFAFTMLICASLSAGTDIESGKRAYEQKDYATALKEFAPLAEQGNAAAQLFLGRMYMMGQGVLKDSDQAIKWFKASASQGNAEAQFFLGTMYLLMDRPRDAEETLRKSLELGPSEFTYSNLGSIAFAAGDYRRALDYYTKARDLRPTRDTTWRNIGDCYAIVDVQFTLSAVVEQAECRVAALLNLRQHDAGAESVDGAGRNEDDITFRNRTPLNQINDRAIRDRRAQFLWCDPSIQADADLRARLRRDDVPCFALAVRHPHRARKRIVRMDLNRQRRAGEQQFEKQGRNRRIAVGALEPKLSHRIHGTVDAAPRLEIADAPGLVHGPHGRVFDGHRVS